MAPRDSALFIMKRDAVLAATPRHAQARVRTSSCETFISLITSPSQRRGAPEAGWVSLVVHIS